MTLWIILAAGALCAALIATLYNRLVGLRVRAQNAWSDIDVQLRRRADLVPNLVESVKGYAAHERETLDAVIAARGRVVAVQGAGPAARAGAEAGLGAALRGMSVAVEAYPRLQASGGFRDLQRELAGVEEQIGAARRYYNAVVRDLNTAVQTFPSNLLAGPLGFREQEFFEASAAERELPAVRF